MMQPTRISPLLPRGSRIRQPGWGGDLPESPVSPIRIVVEWIVASDLIDALSILLGSPSNSATRSQGASLLPERSTCLKQNLFHSRMTCTDGSAEHRVPGMRLTPRAVEPHKAWHRTLIQSGGDGRGRARLCAGGTPALPGDAAPSYGAGACLNNGSRCVLQRFGRVWRRRRGFLALQPRAHVKWLPPVR